MLYYCVYMYVYKEVFNIFKLALRINIETKGKIFFDITLFLLFIISILTLALFSRLLFLYSHMFYEYIMRFIINLHLHFFVQNELEKVCARKFLWIPWDSYTHNSGGLYHSWDSFKNFVKNICFCSFGSLNFFWRRSIEIVDKDSIPGIMATGKNGDQGPVS